MSAVVVGVDVGGTFTDLILMERGAEGHPRLGLAKVPTTVDNQAFGVLAALKAAGADLSAVAELVHGTTTTTNALLERKIARVGLITTAGFRDVLELGRRTRPQPYGMFGRFEPLIPRELRLEVAERVDADGQILTPLDEAAVSRACEALIAAGCEALVIHFLHAYRNPAHELRAGEIARDIWPTRHVTLGHALISEYREYERGVTAAVNASVQPVLDRYLEKLTGELSRQGYTRDLLLMQGNGGTVAAKIAAHEAVKTVMSGPATGVMAAAFTARSAGIANLVTYDMGGTSTDVGLILDGVPAVSSELELEYAMPIHVPMVDVHTIGSGGGSLAYVDEAGLLQVGPESAGATPGPICFGRGGTRPTITDANLLLGRLDPERLLSVETAPSLEALRDAFAREIGDPLGLDADAAAAAVVRIANDKMAGAIRMVSLSRGHDPRDFALFAFGGAGPLHATALARELAIPSVLVPARPGITNALGCIVADLRHDYVRTVNVPLPAADMAEVHAIFAEQTAEGLATIEREGVHVEATQALYFADMQFQGQTHLLTVAVDDPKISREALHEAFAKAYWQRFMVELPEIRPVLVNLHTAVIGKRPSVALEGLLPPEARANRVEDAQLGERRVWFAPGGWQTTTVYARDKLPFGAELAGPAIVQQLDTTLVLEPGDRLTVDGAGNLLVAVGRPA
jgi:N-methylhydantoinase A